jgi:hypothetical protein
MYLPCRQQEKKKIIMSKDVKSIPLQPWVEKVGQEGASQFK